MLDRTSSKTINRTTGRSLTCIKPGISLIRRDPRLTGSARRRAEMPELVVLWKDKVHGYGLAAQRNHFTAATKPA